MTSALFFGDSISDDPNGQYCAMVCAALGWTRVGQTPGDANRAAIAGTPLAELGPDAAVRACAGARTFAARVAARAPDVLVINYGSNDAWLMGEYEDLNLYRDAWANVAAQIKALPKPPRLIALGLMATWSGASPWWSYNAEWLRAQMDAITAQTILAAGGRFVSLAGMRADQVRDDCHPNARGHAYIAGEILVAAGAR